MDLVKRLAKFIIEKDLKNDLIKIEPGILLTMKLVVEDTPEFGRILISLSFFSRNCNKIDLNCDELLRIVKHGMLSSASIIIHGHKEKKDKVIDIINQNIKYNGKDYGQDEKVLSLWKDVAERIVQLLSEREKQKKPSHAKALA